MKGLVYNHPLQQQGGLEGPGHGLAVARSKMEQVCIQYEAKHLILHFFKGPPL
jgi:hypothetical protein